MTISLISVENAIDMHVHTSPSLFRRIGDDIDIARQSKDKGLQGFVSKSHFESTVSRAHYATKAVEGIKVFGGIVLNQFVGGINPSAVEACLMLGGKIVWMPTLDAANHAKVFGSTRTYGRKSMDISEKAVKFKGITILQDGQLTEETKVIVKLIREYGAVLGTGHLSKEEIYQLVKFCKTEKAKVLINHPYYPVPKLTLPEIQELIGEGAHGEFNYATLDPMNNATTLEEVKHTINTLGAENCVIATDSGQPFRPMPAETFRIYAQMLHEKGTSVEQLKKLMIEVPQKLLNI
jgi:hypothetical protein